MESEYEYEMVKRVYLDNENFLCGVYLKKDTYNKIYGCKIKIYKSFKFLFIFTSHYTIYQETFNLFSPVTMSQSELCYYLKEKIEKTIIGMKEELNKVDNSFENWDGVLDSKI